MKRLGFILTFLLLWVGIAPVWACYPPTPNADGSNAWSIENFTPDASIIFVGTVVDILHQHDSINDYQAEIAIEYYLKGAGYNIQVVNFPFDIVGWCLPYPESGERLIFFANGNPDGVLQGFYYRDPSEEAKVIAITNQSISPKDAAPIVQTAHFVHKYDMWMFCFVLGFVCLAGIRYLFKHLNNRRKPKPNSLP